MAAASRKAQIKNLQNAILLVFFVIALIIFSMFFYSNITHRMKQDVEEIRHIQTILAVAGISQMGEFSCSGIDYCIDFEKVKAFNQLRRSSPEYADYLFSRLGFAKVHLHSQSTGNQLAEVYAREPETGEFSRILRFNIPCLIYDADSEKGSLGYFNITMYQR
ncbi:MAG TPA: hypothetical protein ENN46_00270 [Candidatus Woesearchaeota archaeon]|nr:hypothetical protein [Candidatus Woesearchaeota archaeon]